MIARIAALLLLLHIARNADLIAYWMFDRREASAAPQHRSWQRIAEMLSYYEEGGGQALSRLERKAIVVELARIPLYWIGETAFLTDPLEAVLAWARHLAVARWLIQRAAAQLEPLLPAG